jgi:RND superfamily putative drug exporter
VLRGDGDTGAYAAGLSQIDGVERVDAIDGSYMAGQRVAPPTAMSQRFAGDESTWLSVVPAVEPVSPDGEKLVADIRATPAPFDSVLVGGPSADLVDGKASLFDRVPTAMALIAGVTFVLLFLMFGSLLVPLKALVLNGLSLTAMFGAMAWIFQDGNLSGPLGFTATGTLDTSMPILMFCMAFGLSMDYEVFLLSRIKEEHDKTGDNRESVVNGVASTARVITSAALIMISVFLAFVPSPDPTVKMIGFGMAVAVLTAATTVRMLLVPSTMELAGTATWWCPRWLDKILPTIHVE